MILNKRWHFIILLLMLALAKVRSAVPVLKASPPAILPLAHAFKLDPPADTLRNISLINPLIWPHRRITSGQMNSGIVHQPVQLVQGLLTGLQVARAGANHSAPFSARFRGIPTFYGNPQPLIVIDGVPAAFLEGVDPGDVEVVSIVADPVAKSSLYGARAAAGIMRIETRSMENDSARVVYSGSIAIEQPILRLRPLEAGEFREFPGVADLGAATDWPAEVSKIGRAHVHRLSIAGQSGRGAYRVSLNLRDVSGIAHNDHFRQLNGRFHASQKILKEKIHIGLHLFSTARAGSPGDPNAFRYAFSTNPTMPVRDASSDRFGGFSQRLLFDAINPVSVYAQSARTDRLHTLGSTLRAVATLARDLKAEVLWSGQQLYRTNGQYVSKSSLYDGGYFRNGLASRAEAQNTAQTIIAGLDFRTRPGVFNLALSGNFSHQRFRSASSEIQAGDFLTDAFSFHNLGAALDIPNGRAKAISHKSAAALTAFSMLGRLQLRDVWEFSAAARYEGASVLGSNARWGLYPALSSSVALAPLLGLSAPLGIYLRAGYSVTGNLPVQPYLSQGRYAPASPFFFNGSYAPSYALATNPNPELSAEQTATFDITLDFSFARNRVAGSIGYYQGKSERLILPVFVSSPPNLAPMTWQNAAGLKNSGIEAALELIIADSRNFSWKTALNVSTFRTVAAKIPDPPFSGFPYIFSAAIGGPGQGSSQSIVPVIVGERLGILWGPIGGGIQSNGSPVFKDLNGDGRYCACDEDHTIIGNGLPRLSTGLQNTVSVGNVQFSLLLRAVLGHELLNTFRLFYENTAVSTLSSYNIVKTKYFDPALKQPGLSDLYVENASFLEINNVRLGYRFPVRTKRYFREIVLFVAAQQPVLLSPYSGISPEPRFPGHDLLAPGIERRDTFWPARTFSIGLTAGMR